MSTTAARSGRVNVYNPALAALLTEDTSLPGVDDAPPGFSISSPSRRLNASGASRHGRSATTPMSRTATAGAGHKRSRRSSQSSMMEALVSSVVVHDPSDSPQRARLRQRHVVMMQRRMEEITAAVQASQKRAARKKELAYMRRTAALEAGMKEAEDIGAKVETHLEERAQRRHEIHTRWEEGVFQKVSDAVHKAVNSRTAKQINRDRNKQYQRYLDATNTRDLFTDIVSSDYDPLRLHKHRPKPKVPRLLDPLKRSIHSKMEEDALILTDAEAEAALASGVPEPEAERGAGDTTRGLRRSKSAGGSTVRSRGRGRPHSVAGRMRTASSGSRGRPTTSGTVRPMTRGSTTQARSMPDGPGFGVPRQNLLGRKGGKWTLPVRQWATGKLEANSAATTVKTRMAGGIFDDHAEMSDAEFRATGLQRATSNRNKMFLDQFSKVTKQQQYNFWNQALPRPQKRTFAPWNHGNILAAMVSGQTDKDVDPDIKRIG